MTETTSDTAMETEPVAVKKEVKTEEEKASETVKTEEKSDVTTVKTEIKEEKKEVKSESKDEDKTDVKTEESTANGSVEVKTENGNPVKADNLLNEEIVQQIHYYFGNHNLPRDKFLQEQIKLDDGWIPIEVMTKFNRLAQISKDTSVYIAALKEQEMPLIEINEDGTKIRRSPSNPLPELNEEWKKNVVERTIYSKGFPPTGVSVGELLTFFKKFGTVDNLQKRTYLEKSTKTLVFKGSVFVTFDSKETAAKYIALESVKWGDTELIRKFQNVYWEDKKKERDEKWGRKTKKDRSGKQGDKKEGDKEVDLCPRGCVLHLAGFPTEDPIDRDEIREKVKAAGGDVAYITYNRGDVEAYIRLEGDDENPAVKLLETIPEKKLKINEVELTARVLEGDEETEFLKKSLQDRDRRRGNNRRGGKNNYARKNNYGRKRRGGDGDSGPQRKSFKRERD